MRSVESCEEESSLLRLIPLVFKISRLGSTKREFHLTKSQLLLMLVLYHNEAVTMKDIAGYISSSKEQATRTVHPLADKGLVERFEHEENRKHVYVRITERGRQLVDAAVKEYHEQASSRIRASLSEEECLKLQEAVSTVAELLDKVE